jgi:small subunit ribosomal protein S9
MRCWCLLRFAADIEMMNKERGQVTGEARVREVDEMFVNGRPIDLYFPYYRRYQLLQAFELTGTLLSFNMSAKVHGGGLAGQLDALKYGIARALQKQDPAYRDVLKDGAH